MSAGLFSAIAREYSGGAQVGPLGAGGKSVKKGIFDKLLGFVGFEEEYEDETETVETHESEIDDRPRERARERDRDRNQPKGKVLSLTTPQQKSMRVVVLEPRNFDEVQQIAAQLRDKRPVILNLEATDKTVARRIIDFISGAVYALEGTVQRINTSIILFAPPGIDVALGAGEERPAMHYRD